MIDNTPLVYDAGVVYVDSGIQPHVAYLGGNYPGPGCEFMDEYGMLFAAAPRMLQLLKDIFESADNTSRDSHSDMEETMYAIECHIKDLMEDLPEGLR